MAEVKAGDGSVLTKFFAHNTWANVKLIDFCAQLNDQQLDAATVGGYGTIRDTLLHIIGAEVGYVRRVNGKLPPLPFTPGEYPSFDIMRAAAQWTGDELLQLALSTREDTLVQEREGNQAVEYTMASLIVQAITHSVEHRTQIATTITQLGLEPPDMSVWYYIERDTGEFREFTI